MRLFDKLLNRNEQHKQKQEERPANEMLPMKIKTKSIKERYPNGLPLEVLKKINYSDFGKILKSEQLLPPSYNRIPEGVEVTASECGDHNIKLIFKSKTSASYRIISIRGYSVSMSTNNASIHYYMHLISREWEKFCAKIAYLYERHWSFDFVNQIKPTDEELGL